MLMWPLLELLKPLASVLVVLIKITPQFLLQAVKLVVVQTQRFTFFTELLC